AGRVVEARVPWTLTLPGPSSDRISRDGDAVRLGSFFPILGWEPGVGWRTEPPTGAFAEASTAPVADFDLTVTVPDGLSALASGTNDRPGHWTAPAMRDVALSVGRFATASATAHAPQPVEVTVGVHQGIAESPQPYVDRVVDILADFAERYGPYPWPAYTLAITPGLGGGIEYPGHVMQGPGTIARTTSHEVGHMWFYGLVGNNQGRDPWLDEGLASWAEARYEGTLAEFRAARQPAAARARMGEPMTYWATAPLAYYAGVYVQGVQALADLGPPDLVDCALRTYAAVFAHRIARPADLVAALRASFPDAADVLSRYGVRT
ncbi:MAG TPA: M1 family aminopeptidase, partial [Acidimicrobiales bacterium]